jgi:hypothetical protein
MHGATIKMRSYLFLWPLFPCRTSCNYPVNGAIFFKTMFFFACSMCFDFSVLSFCKFSNQKNLVTNYCKIYVSIIFVKF